MLIALVAGVFQLVTSLPRLPLPHPAPGAIEAFANNNVRRAGTLEGKTLTLNLEVVEGAGVRRARRIPRSRSSRSRNKAATLRYRDR
jgi:hypothetical protein